MTLQTKAYFLLCKMETGSRELKIKSHSILEDYEVQWNQKLGCGISGPVRPCKKKSTGDNFALKCLIDKPRSRREVTLHFKCGDHPHIVRVFDCYANEVQFAGEQEPKSRLLLVMELMDGGELFDRISKQKYFTESQASRYTKQICLAIKKCHSMNIAHRDIKPENVLLKDNSENAIIKLSDFGFAKEDDGSLMTPHFTPYYVAPQILEAQTNQARQLCHIIPDRSPYTYDKSCDMWSLGVIIYIMLCGYPPFYSETPSKQITRNMKRKIMAGEYEFPEEDWSHISTPAKDLVKRLLTVDVGNRLTVDQVLEHPWLYQAPHTQLNSPAVMLDQNTFQEAQFAHSAQLTAMRLPDQQLMLKPIHQVDNPILRKRRNSKVLSEELGEPPVKSPAKNVCLEALRDVIAYCIMPPKVTEEQYVGMLNSLVKRACDCFHDNPAVASLFAKYGWTGESFHCGESGALERQTMAFGLSQLVQQITAQQQHQKQQQTFDQQSVETHSQKSSTSTVTSSQWREAQSSNSETSETSSSSWSSASASMNSNTNNGTNDSETKMAALRNETESNMAALRNESETKMAAVRNNHDDNMSSANRNAQTVRDREGPGEFQVPLPVAKKNANLSAANWTATSKRPYQTKPDTSSAAT